MPYLFVFVDDRTLHVLHRQASVTGNTVEQVATQFIESQAVSLLPGGNHGMNYGPQIHRVDLGSTSIGLKENTDGSISIVS